MRRKILSAKLMQRRYATRETGASVKRFDDVAHTKRSFFVRLCLVYVEARVVTQVLFLNGRSLASTMFRYVQWHR